MNIRVQSAAYVLLAGCAAAIAQAAEPTQLPKAPPLACTIRSEPTCELGKVPSIAVQISNWTDDDICLVGSLDASDCKWRYPLCYFEVIGPNGKSPVLNVARCGNMNAIREKDFVRVARGGKFDPYQKVDDHGFFGSSQITPATFRAEGDYRIRFIYSTEKSELRFWLGDAKGAREEVLPTSAADEKIMKLLEKVPKTTVSSNEIIVKIVPAKN